MLPENLGFTKMSNLSIYDGNLIELFTASIHQLKASVDDVVTGKIDRKKLREVPQKVELLKKELGREIQFIEERLDTSVKDIRNAQGRLAIIENFKEELQRRGGVVPFHPVTVTFSCRMLHV